MRSAKKMWKLWNLFSIGKEKKKKVKTMKSQPYSWSFDTKIIHPTMGHANQIKKYIIKRKIILSG